MSGAADPLPAALRAAVPGGVLTDAALLAGYCTDWTGRWVGSARAVVRPRSLAELTAALRACQAAAAHVVVQGGNTGLVAGAVPDPGDVLVSLRRLDAVEAVDPVSATAVVAAGATLASLQRAAGRHGLELPVDLAARDSATLGGMAATNAGGVRALTAGSMRSHVLAMDALDVDGRPLTSLKRLVKDNTGYALGALLVGSEGTLGIITRLLVRLAPVDPARAGALLGLADLDSVLGVVAAVRARLPGLRAAELLDAATLALVTRHAGLPPALPGCAPFLLLVETGGATGVAEELAATLAELAGQGELDPELTRLATEAAELRRLWAYRERATEAVAAAGTPHKLDVTLPTDELAAFHRELRQALRARPGLAGYVWGHVGDGNLHVNVLGADPGDTAVDAEVLRLVAAHHGSISAEHGIGRAKAAYLPLARTEDEIAAMRAVKAALDPAGRLGVPLLGGG